MARKPVKTEEPKAAPLKKAGKKRKPIPTAQVVKAVAVAKAKNQPALPSVNVQHTWQNMNINPGGAPALFEDVDYFMLCCSRYFEWCVENPMIRYEAVKSGDNCGTLVEVPIMRPFTIHGLCVFIGGNPSWFRTKKSLFNKLVYETEAGLNDSELDRIGRENPKYLTAKKFLAAFSLIESIIYQQKYDGAATNLFNSNFIARDLNLNDNVSHTLNQDGQDDLPPVTTINVHDTKIELPEDEDEVEP